MDKQYLREKLDAMRQNFVESTHHERAVGVLDQAHMSKKMLKNQEKISCSWNGTVPEKNWAQRLFQDWPKNQRAEGDFLNPVVKKIKEDVRGITDLPHPIFTGFDCLKYHQ